MLRVPHEYGPSGVGHGEAQCIHCYGTNRENAVVSPEHCEKRAAKLSGDTTTSPDELRQAAALPDPEYHRYLLGLAAAEIDHRDQQLKQATDHEVAYMAEITALKRDNGRLMKAATFAIAAVGAVHQQLLEHAEVCGESAYPVSLRLSEHPWQTSKGAAYSAMMARMIQLMETDPDPTSAEGMELNLLATLAEFYERDHAAESIPQP